ncbi:hypothetical protein N8198_00685 [Gammaproteobacteria bacterium]|nr:hypothetical protein [Gammaproteobacteria bacterium]
MKPRIMIRRAIWMILFLFPASASSQSSSEFDQWKQQFLTEFDTYKDEMDRDFAEFLKTEWKKFPTQAGIERDPVPKPVAMPRDTPKIVSIPPPVAPTDIPDPPKVEIRPPLQTPVIARGNKVMLMFLGHELALYTLIDKNFSLSQTINQPGLQSGFDTLAKSDYESLTADLLKIRKELRLNDWAYIQLVRQFSQRFLPKSQNSARLLSWFLLLKSDIKIRLAFADNEVYLLMPTQQALYGVSYFKFDNEKFYIISEHVSVSNRLYSYNGSYPKKLARSNLTGISDIITGTAFGYRDISFDYGGTQFDLRVPFNKHAIDFFATYPQMDIEHYFNVAISRETRQALLTQLKPLMAQLSREEAVNFLLRLVQTGFDYETDQIQFGSENYLFLEETIFYPGSDCEDRSVIFAWLVENLLGMEVIGLDFPGHVATAVLLDNPSGEQVEYAGKVFTVADPTYIYASVGRKMSQFKNINPNVINYNR